MFKVERLYLDFKMTEKKIERRKVDYCAWNNLLNSIVGLFGKVHFGITCGVNIGVFG
jgi:hypothetical protein